MVYFDIFKYMYIILTFKFYTPIANRYLSSYNGQPMQCTKNSVDGCWHSLLMHEKHKYRHSCF